MHAKQLEIYSFPQIAGSACSALPSKERERNIGECKTLIHSQPGSGHLIQDSIELWCFSHDIIATASEVQFPLSIPNYLSPLMREVNYPSVIS